MKTPRIEDRAAFHVAGLSEQYTFETNHGIPALWRQFGPHIGRMPGQVGNAAYGVCYNGDAGNGFDYIAGVEVGHFDDLPGEFARLTIPAQRYAVFTHSGHVSGIRKTTYTIWNQWLPEADVTHGGGPDFELYGERFDGNTGTGDVEIWIPVR